MSKNPYTTDKLGEIVSLCLRNSEQFINDAKELMKSGSYGHAVALLVFSIEESGKALMLFISKQTKKAVSPRHVKSHLKKIRANATCDLLRDIVLPVYEENFPKVLETVEKCGTDDIQLIADELYAHYSKLLRRRLDTLLSEGNGVMLKELEEKRDYYSRLEDYRIDGLYVDVKDDGSISSPFRFDESGAEELLLRAEHCYWIIKNSIKDVALVPDELMKAFQRAKYVDCRRSS